jgi:16S rRNA (uracil1498-N3)-methyltransferase
MQNLPRLFIDADLAAGKEFPLTRDQAHYLMRVMRTDKFLAFNNGQEFYAELAQDNNRFSFFVSHISEHTDPSNNLIFAFAPIKQSRMEEMLNAATQLGVAKLQPVITERTTERFPKWDRIRKIIVEASEQSGRNSIPELLPPIKFAEFLQNENIVFADERFAHNEFPSCGGVPPTGAGWFRDSEIKSLATPARAPSSATPPMEGNLNRATLLIGPEGGFSPAEFAALDASGASGISLGKTILRTEVAAIAALSLVVSSW